MVPFETDRSKVLPRSQWRAGFTPAILQACGAFSPPTVLHTAIFEWARDHFRENAECKIHIVGGFISPVHDLYGKKDLKKAGHRCEMVRCDGFHPRKPATQWLALLHAVLSPAFLGFFPGFHMAVRKEWARLLRMNHLGS